MHHDNQLNHHFHQYGHFKYSVNPVSLTVHACMRRDTAAAVPLPSLLGFLALHLVIILALPHWLSSQAGFGRWESQGKIRIEQERECGHLPVKEENNDGGSEDELVFDCL